MIDKVSELAAKIRSSVVGIVSPTSQGSGYCALPNGLIVTSLDVVGYEREVQLTFEDGRAMLGAVVRANVALDIALVVPLERAPLVALEAGGEARIGDSVLTVGRIGSEPFVVTSRVVSTNRVCEGFAHLQLDVASDDVLIGAPVVSRTGGVLGVTVRPRKNRVLGDRNAHRWITGLVLPLSAYEGGLMSADGPTEEVLALQPEYGCPRCDTIFEPDYDRCLECGGLLPHRWIRAMRHELDRPAAAPPTKGIFAVKAALASLGIPANRARVGAGTWRFAPSLQEESVQTQIDVTMDDSGDHVVLRAPLVRLPLEGFENVYRHLLALNDETSGPFRFGTIDRTVYLSLLEPARTIDTMTFPTTVTEFSAAVARYRSSLQRSFGLEPAFDHDID